MASSTIHMHPQIPYFVHSLVAYMEISRLRRVKLSEMLLAMGQRQGRLMTVRCLHYSNAEERNQPSSALGGEVQFVQVVRWPRVHDNIEDAI